MTSFYNQPLPLSRPAHTDQLTGTNVIYFRKYFLDIHSTREIRLFDSDTDFYRDNLAVRDSLSSELYTCCDVLLNDCI